MNKTDFFIGWQEKLPRSSRSVIVKLLLTFLLIGLGVILLFVMNQTRFNNHFFQFGKIQVVTGTYFQEPVPVLRVSEGIDDDNVSKDLLLVGYGKSGSEGIMKNIQNQHGSLVGKSIKIQGSLIHGDGRSVFELTNKEESYLETSSQEISLDNNKEIGEIMELKGEILDPKCYFGIMKPGEGKIHKSCAIRCISGGIPPVLKVNENGSNQYYVILGKNGLKINKALLDFIAEPVKLKGITYNMNGWNFIEVSPTTIQIIKS